MRPLGIRFAGIPNLIEKSVREGGLRQVGAGEMEASGFDDMRAAWFCSWERV